MKYSRKPTKLWSRTDSRKVLENKPHPTQKKRNPEIERLDAKFLSIQKIGSENVLELLTHFLET